jgi:hypothetical protein
MRARPSIRCGFFATPTTSSPRDGSLGHPSSKKARMARDGGTMLGRNGALRFRRPCHEGLRFRRPCHEGLRFRRPCHEDPRCPRGMLFRKWSSRKEGASCPLTGFPRTPCFLPRWSCCFSWPPGRVGRPARRSSGMVETMLPRRTRPKAKPTTAPRPSDPERSDRR